MSIRISIHPSNCPSVRPGGCTSKTKGMCTILATAGMAGKTDYTAKCVNAKCGHSLGLRLWLCSLHATVRPTVHVRSRTGERFTMEEAVLRDFPGSSPRRAAAPLLRYIPGITMGEFTFYTTHAGTTLRFAFVSECVCVCSMRENGN